MSTGLDTLATPTITRRPLKPEELDPEVALLGPSWSVSGGELRLQLTGPMTRTAAAAAFAGALADELDHHPKIVIEYAGLVLTINTHDARAITVIDLIYAARLEQWLRVHGWPANDG